MWTRWFRASLFRKAAENFARLLYSVDIDEFDDERLAEVERMTRVSINVVESHMLLRYTQRDTAECRACAVIISRLRQALEGIEAGLHPDPAKRPTRAQLLDEFAADLERHPLNLAAHTGCAPASTA